MNYPTSGQPGTKLRSYVGAKLSARPACQAAILAIIGTAAFAAPALAEERPATPEWTVRLGGGVGVAPTFQGSDNYEIVPLPLAELKWRDRVSLGPQGLAGTVFKDENFRFGARLGYNGGRDQDDDNALRGLGDVDPTVEGGVFAAYTFGGWTLAGQVSQDLADGHGGAVATSGLTYGRPLSENVLGSVGVSATWASDDYMQSFFGVTPVQSATSGYAPFQAESGFKDIGANASLTYLFDRNWSMTGIGKYTRLTGDAADSPIVRDEDQLFVGTVLGYSF